jgi:hypothetical protein
MKTTTKRLLVLALLLLVAVPTSVAAADCGWVMWTITHLPSGRTLWLVIGGRESFADCERWRVETLNDPKLPRLTTPICLPGTVDPREKGQP